MHAALAGPPQPEAGGRMMLIAAHPDNETIAAGSRFGHIAEVLLVHVTDGAPRMGADTRQARCSDWRHYAALRRRELETATALAGVRSEQLLSLG